MRSGRGAVRVRNGIIKGDLRRRKSLLDEAFIYQRAIDRETYKAQAASIREDMRLAEVELLDAKIEELDLAILSFAGWAFGNTARLWSRRTPAEKHAFGRLCFPKAWPKVVRNRPEAAFICT